MRLGMFLGVVLLATAMLAGPGFAEPVAPKGPLNTTADIRQALRGCWQWPPASEARSGHGADSASEFQTQRRNFRRPHHLPDA